MDSYNQFAQYYDLLMSDVDYNSWAFYIKQLIEKFEADGCRVHSVLDCACGTGSVTIPLAKLGYEMVGLDISEEMLEIASQKMRKNGQRCIFVRGDMQNIKLHKCVDSIISCCDGVNYLTDNAQLTKFLSSAHSVLNENGLLLFDISSEYKLSEILGNNTFGEDREECTYLWENEYDCSKRTIRMDLHFFTENSSGTYDRFDETHIQKAYTAEEIENALNINGFEVLGIFDAFTLNPFSKNSERIEFVSRRKEL